MNAVEAIISTMILCDKKEAIKMTAQARHPTKATFMPFLCYWATLINILKSPYLLVGETLQAPQNCTRGSHSHHWRVCLGESYTAD